MVLEPGRDRGIDKHTDAFCDKVVKCMQAQWASDAIQNDEVYIAADGHDDEEQEWRQFVDDRTGLMLNGKHVAAARRKEIRTLEEHGAYTKVPRWYAVQRCKELGTQVLGMRWLDTNKADIGQPPDVRARGGTRVRRQGS